MNRRGQVSIILILIAIFILVLIFGMFFAGRFFLPRPTVTEVYWTVDGRRTYVAQVGMKVRAHVFLASNTEFTGDIIIKIKRDLRFWPDSELTSQSFSLSMAPGSIRELTVEFYPDEPSQNATVAPESVRGYFVEIDFPIGHGSWTMENAYPPRLVVTPQD